MGRVHLSQSPLTQIFIKRDRLKWDKFFRLYAFLWIVLFACVGVYTFFQVLKSVDSYTTPNRRIHLVTMDHIPFPPIVYCASNTEYVDFRPKSCVFYPRGPSRPSFGECDTVNVTLHLIVQDVPVPHPCVILRGLHVSPSPSPSSSPPAASTSASTKLATNALLVVGEETEHAADDSPLSGRNPANATFPASQFQMVFEVQNSSGDILFFVTPRKTVTESESSTNRYVPLPGDKNFGIPVPRAVDNWLRLYPDRTEEVKLKLTTVTYLDETVVFRYNPALRPIPCLLPEGQDCATKVSTHVRFDSLEAEDAEEEVTFDWLYVLGAVGGGLTVAELTFMVLHPLMQRILFGKRKEGEEGEEETDEESHRDPLISKQQ